MHDSTSDELLLFLRKRLIMQIYTRVKCSPASSTKCLVFSGASLSAAELAFDLLLSFSFAYYFILYL